MKMEMTKTLRKSVVKYGIMLKAYRGQWGGGQGVAAGLRYFPGTACLDWQCTGGIDCVLDLRRTGSAAGSPGPVQA